MSSDSKVCASSTDDHYMVSPLWDLVFIINAPWVLVAVGHLLFLKGGFPDVTDFRYLYLTLPHRFVTLALVYLDRDTFATRPVTFIGLPLVFVGVVLTGQFLGAGLVSGTNTILCLLTVDYVWNAYHFGSQHYGVTRIYGRKADSGHPRLERAVVVGAVTWGLLRAPNWTLVDGPAAVLFAALDVVTVLGLLTLIVIELKSGVSSVPKLCYLTSVTCLYGGIIICPYVELRGLRQGLLAATGFFHAVEYLAIVHFYVKGKLGRGGFRSGPFRVVAPIWSQAFLVFALGVGTLVLFSRQNLPAGTFLPVLAVASFCHYAFDGMIWKLRKPAVSQALGADGASAVS